MAITTFSWRVYFRLLILSLYLSGCGSTIPFQNVPLTQSFDEVTFQLADEIHKAISNASVQGTIPPSLDVAIYRIVEQTSEHEYLFGRDIKGNLIGKLRQRLSTIQPTPNTVDINYLANKKTISGNSITKMGDLVQTHLYQPFTKPEDEISLSVIASKLKANLIISGEYRLLQNREILISVQIVLPRQNRIIEERQIRLRSRQVLRRYYGTSFSEGIEKKFDHFYNNLKDMRVENIFKALNIEWRAEYNWGQKEKVRQLVVEKVDISLNKLLQQLKPLSFASSIDLLKKERRQNLYSYSHQTKIQQSIAEKLSLDFPKLQKTLLTSDFKHFKEIAPIHQSYLSMVNQIKNESFWEINSILETHWRPQFTEEHKKHLLKLVHQKMKLALQNLGNFLPNVSELRKRRINIRSLRRSVFLKKIASALQLSDIEKVSLMKQEKNLFLIEKALRDGFPVTVEFIGTSPKNEPLGFSCKGFFSNHKVSLTLQKSRLSYTNARCKTEGLRQIISWPNPFHLFSFGKIRVQAVEKNLLFADKKFLGSVFVNKENLLRLYQKKQDLFPIQGSDYSIRFTRLP